MSTATEPKMKVRSIAPWFGGKRTLAPDIVRQLGPHEQYFEPFCGSLAVLLRKAESVQETAIDLHFDVVNLARVLQVERTAIELYEKLQHVLVDERMLDEARRFLHEGPESQDMVERAFWYFISIWQARNGVAGLDRQNFQAAVRWTSGGGSPAVRWRSAWESIPAFHRRLANVVMLKRDAFQCLHRFEDKKNTAIYVDTPYHDEARSHGRYLHDFDVPQSGLFTDENADPHQLIADILSEYKRARIVVSHYDCPEVRRIYEGWTFIHKTMDKGICQQNKRGIGGKETAPEVLIVNGNEYSG